MIRIDHLYCEAEVLKKICLKFQYENEIRIFSRLSIRFESFWFTGYLKIFGFTEYVRTTLTTIARQHVTTLELRDTMTPKVRIQFKRSSCQRTLCSQMC